MDFYYRNKRQDDLQSARLEDADAIPDRIKLEGEAATLNKKFQTSWNERAKGKISDEDLAKSILEISKHGVESSKKKRPSR